MARKLSELRLSNDRKFFASITLSIKARPTLTNHRDLCQCVELRTSQNFQPFGNRNSESFRATITARDRGFTDKYDLSLKGGRVFWSFLDQLTWSTPFLPLKNMLNKHLHHARWPWQASQTKISQPGRALIDNVISVKTAWLIPVNGLRILLYINKSWLTDLHEVHSFSL